MTYEYLFCLHKVSRIAVSIYAATIKPGPCHMLAAATDEAIIKREIVIFTINFFYMTLHNRNSPT
jgi:hypothetical protein